MQDDAEVQSSVSVDSLIFDPAIFDMYEYDSVYHGDTLILTARVKQMSYDTIAWSEEEVFIPESIPEVKQKTKVDFYHGPSDQFYSTGIEQHRVMIYYFSASWCAPCREVEKTLFMDKEIADAIRKDFLIAKIDIESYEGFELKEQMGVRELPTFIFQGINEISRFSGMTDSYFFLKQMKAALESRP